MNGHGQSDRSVVPANPPDKAARAAAEAGEERERAKGNTGSETRPGRSAGSGVSSELDRVREVARRDKDARFTALLHHVSLHRLGLAFDEVNPKAAPGVDGVSWAEYEQDLGANLRDLHERVQSGRYRASPSRRAYIPKADGRQRPLGIATVTSYCLSCSRVLGCLLDRCGAVLVRPSGPRSRVR
jgi:RNA-directed DNA polymerase